jgi:ABC-type branched-subunit amino acid transport system ATPase component
MGGQIQVIGGDGTYAGDAVEAFLQGHAVSNAGVGYTTVAIMGPQSSGKSTLLNAVVPFRIQWATCDIALANLAALTGRAPANEVEG